MKRLENKVAVVTGGGSGIGQSIAQRFAQEGAQVAILELNPQGATATVEQVQAQGGHAKAYACDVSHQEGVRQAMANVREDYGQLDILVNNAGIAHVGNVENTAESDFDRIFQVNVKGVYNGMKAVVPLMVSQGKGVILNLASIASKIGLADRFAYSMSKGAVLTMTFSVAKDYIDQGIRCNCVCPARVHTPFVDGYLKQNYPGAEAAMFEQLSQYQPIGRMGKPHEVANLALFLCSDEAEFITGAAYDIDGGVTTLK